MGTPTNKCLLLAQRIVQTLLIQPCCALAALISSVQSLSVVLLGSTTWPLCLHYQFMLISPTWKRDARFSLLKLAVLPWTPTWISLRLHRTSGTTHRTDDDWDACVASSLLTCLLSCTNFTGADLAALLREAGIASIRRSVVLSGDAVEEKALCLTASDFEIALGKVSAIKPSLDVCY